MKTKEKPRKSLFVLTLVTCIVLWQIVSGNNVVNRTLFPPPTEVLDSLIELTASGELLVHVNTSLWRVIAGLTLGSIAGIWAGLLTGRMRVLDETLSPIFHVLRSFPPVAIIPLVIVWLGIGESAKLFSINFAVFFPVWINTHIGASNIPVHYLQATSTLTDSISKKWLNVILPSSIPFIIAGIRTGIGVAFIMVFVSELAGSSSGLGYFISISHLAYRIDKMIAGLILLGLLGAVTDKIFIKLIRRIFPWIEKTG